MCNHKRTQEIQASKEVAGLVFEYKTLSCKDCGATLWGSDTEKEFRAWLSQQAKDNRDRFTIQSVVVSDALRAFASEFAARYGKTESDTYQACLSYYFVFGASRPDHVKVIDKIVPIGGACSKKKVRVNPSVFVKIEAMAKLMGSNNSHIASWVIQRVLTAAKEQLDEVNSSLEFAMAA